MHKKSRLELHKEMASAAVACHDYYVDQPLGNDFRDKLMAFLDENLPKEFTHRQWSKYVAAYGKQCKERV